MPEVIDFTTLSSTPSPPERVMSSRSSRRGTAKRGAWTHTGLFEDKSEKESEEFSVLSVRGLQGKKKEEKKNVWLEHFQAELKTALALEARGHAIETRRKALQSSAKLCKAMQSYAKLCKAMQSFSFRVV